MPNRYDHTLKGLQRRWRYEQTERARLRQAIYKTKKRLKTARGAKRETIIWRLNGLEAAKRALPPPKNKSRYPLDNGVATA